MSFDQGETVTAEELAAIPEFAGVKVEEWERQFKFNDRAIVRRTFKPGDLVCKEGEYVYTAFHIVSGSLEIFLAAPIAHVKSQSLVQSSVGSSFTMTGRLDTMSSLVIAKHDPREEEQFRTFIPLDATIDVSYEKPTAVLGPGDLVGEMSCLSFYPRAATVRATTECVAYEMQRNVLELLKKKSKPFAAKIESTYRERVLSTHLRSIPAFATLTDDFIEQLKDKVTIESLDPGDVIAKEGDEPTALYLIRLGFVKVSRAYPGGEMVLAYLSRGQSFGEKALFLEEKLDVSGAALDHVEIVKVSKEDFQEMLARFPDVRRSFKSQVKAQMKKKVSDLPNTIEIRLRDLLDQKLMNAQNMLLIDLDRCTRCDECVQACADAHQGITRLLRDGLRFDHYLVATSCRQCTDPVCMIGCPVGSIRRRETLEVIIEDWCIGCDKCVKQCPYGNITAHEFDVANVERVYEGQKPVEKEDERRPGHKRAVIKKAVTCDLCEKLPVPSCVYACPHDAAHRVDPNDFFDKEYAREERKRRRKRKEAPVEKKSLLSRLASFVPIKSSRVSAAAGPVVAAVAPAGPVVAAVAPAAQASPTPAPKPVEAKVAEQLPAVEKPSSKPAPKAAKSTPPVEEQLAQAPAASAPPKAPADPAAKPEIGKKTATPAADPAAAGKSVASPSPQRPASSDIDEQKTLEPKAPVKMRWQTIKRSKPDPKPPENPTA